MRGYLAWIGAIVMACALITTPVHAQSANTVKPYIFFIMDVSGSMNDPTNFGLPSCAAATTDTLLTHAKCAFNNIVNSYGDIVMALGRFRQSTTDTNPANGCTMNGVDCDPDNDGDSCEQDPTDCPPGLYGGDRLQVLVPIVEDNQADLVSWVDFAQNTCGTSNAQDPELFQNGATPLAGSLRGAKLYWQGQSSPTQGPYWTGPGDDPVRDDPLKLVTNPDGTQCRPYITILLTDGEETCAPTFSETTDAATALLTTVVDGRTYRIETKPIGFGIAPGNAQIEAIAHAGGEPDAAGNQGAYAQNEEELSLEISAIIADAVKFETCNGIDDDCDAAIDEDFPDVGDACDDGELGVCRDTGIFVCNDAGTGVRCNAVDSDPTIPPTDGCNGIDDDCDGVTDEDCVPCGDTELCNGEDDDCDTRIDENLTRPCGTDIGVCVAGTETCRAGDWVDCTATGGAAETCDREDDDCDASTDEQVPGNGDPCTTGAGCPGTRACVNGGMTCVGAPPGTEVCDGIDNNCNGQVDEGTGGGTCGSGCTVGTIVCRDGSLVCEGSSEPGDEICNGRDDDCDIIIDEGVAEGAECAAPGTCGGRERCVGGTMQCVADLPEPEICDCEDGDCDGVEDPDEDPPVCQSGASCVDPTIGPCQCAFPCGDGEFPCSIGQTCDDPDGPGGDPGFCVADPCFGITCPAGPAGERQLCTGDAQCVPACDLEECPLGRRCLPTTGRCVADNCANFPDTCAANEVCIAAVCTANPCAGVTCDGDTYCVNGACEESCAGVECADGQRCRLGRCEADPCGGPCPDGEACNPATMRCTECEVCPDGQICDPVNGGCKQDPCVGTMCPGSGQVCRDGTCFDPEDVAPDAGVAAEYVSAGGGGGCDAGAGTGGAMALVIAALATRRRRAAGGGS